MVFNVTGIIMIVALLIILFVFRSILNKKDKQLIDKEFVILFVLLVIYMFGLIFQIIFSKSIVPPIYFDYITYIAAIFLPVIFMYIAMTYSNKDIDVKKYLWLCIVPIVSLLILWTNDFHHLFYEQYSTNINEVKNGKYMNVHILYTYILFGIAFIRIVISSVKKSGFLSIQTLLILLGELAPFVPNVLGTLKIINMSIYVTPIMFAATAVCFYIAIIKLKALNVIPVAVKTIMNTMTDSFIVISRDGTIADINKTCMDKFEPIMSLKQNDNLYDAIHDNKINDLMDIRGTVFDAVRNEDTITKEYHIKKDSFDKYFEVDFQPIKSRDNSEYVATLLLLRDITVAKKDMEIMMKNESLVMLGELAGGVAHDINTPISAIKSGLLMFKDIAKTDDEKMLVERMDSCANKIVTLTNSLRNQIRNIGSEEVALINVTSVVKDLAVIIHNELTKHKVNLELDIKEEITVKGNSAKLSQVITNIVVNAIQAYDDRGGQVILKVYKDGENAVISVQDFAGGIPENIQENIGKNILTTKGVSGTGFGLYLAYSVIKGAFGGEITFDTKVGEGTIFYITIPIV